jgi:hypothetical protein
MRAEKKKENRKQFRKPDDAEPQKTQTVVVVA